MVLQHFGERFDSPSISWWFLDCKTFLKNFHESNHSVMHYLFAHKRPYSSGEHRELFCLLICGIRHFRIISKVSWSNFVRKYLMHYDTAWYKRSTESSEILEKFPKSRNYQLIDQLLNCSSKSWSTTLINETYPHSLLKFVPCLGWHET